MRIVLTEEPYNIPATGWMQPGWPAKWIGHPEVHGTEPMVTAYRRQFSLEKDAKFRIHVSADERYDLFLDGERIGRGPERGDRENWHYESYDLDLKAGKHVIVARTWWLGGNGPAPYAQHTVSPGFLLATEGVPDDLLNTSKTVWDCKVLGGYRWVRPGNAWGTGAKVHIVGGEFPWGFETGAGDGWVRAQVIAPAANASVANEFPLVWLLRPATLPPPIDKAVHTGEARHIQAFETEIAKPIQILKANHLVSEAEPWDRLLEGKSPLTIPANTDRYAIVDLGNYYCAYPELILSGGKGSKVRVHWAEALYETPTVGAKGNRDEIEGKYFIGFGDLFETDGGKNRRFETLWWEAGRYLEFFVSTGSEPLTIESFLIHETRYPYQFESRFESADPRLEEVTPIMIRALEMCSHETYMDCPYYEQLQYVGDNRLEVLATYALTRDDRLPREAIYAYDVSRKISGITQSRYPSRIMQIIPPFSLWWIGMVHDYAMWRDDMDFVKDRMPGVRAVLDAFRRWVNKDDLLEGPIGWNFMDWVPGWAHGMPPDGNHGISGVINWQFALILGLAAELEDYMGEPELAARNRKLQYRVKKAATEAFWDEGRGIFADDLSKAHFSEHSQCLALLGDHVDDSKRDRVINGLLHDSDLARTTIYFTHYLFETYRLLGRMDRFFERMGLWFDLKGQGFKTTLEHPEPSRSDCHAWGAHPYYHYFATILGIRPAAPGFAKVSIQPQLWPLTWAKGKLPHPKGFIEVDFAIKDDKLSGAIELPKGITGTLMYNGRTTDLKPGKQTI